MRCEIIAIGTELLLGQITDTNSSWMGEQLALAGIDNLHQSKVGDNLERMVGALRLALSRSEAVILCGGLGPTQDDITREAVAEVMGVELVRDEIIAERIRAMFAARRRTMAENNLRQADVPEGARTIEQMPGTAPGLVCPIGEQVVYAVPGVPHEMREMMEGTVLPDLQRRAGNPAVIRSRVIRTWGLSESGIAEILAERIEKLDELGNPTLAFQASGMEGIKVRVTSKSATEPEAAAVLDAEEARTRELLGRSVFGVDEDSMESVVLARLRERGKTLAIAETLTGGLMGSRLTLIDGAGDVYRGGVVCTGPESERAGLGVEIESLDAGERAAALARAVAGRLNAVVGLAAERVIPDDAEAAARGAVQLGLAIDGEIRTEEVRLPGNLPRIRQYAVISVLNLLRQTLG